VRLLLFDIDGTLLRAHGIGARAMERAGRRVLGAGFTLDGIDFGGALDPWIFREAARRLGHDDPSEFHAAFRDEYLAELPGEIEVAGSGLARSLGDLGLIDEYQIYLHPVVIGSGKPYFAGPRPPLRLVANDRIGEDAIRLTYVPA